MGAVECQRMSTCRLKQLESKRTSGHVQVHVQIQYPRPYPCRLNIPGYGITRTWHTRLVIASISEETAQHQSATAA